ncbi:hypothetical protein, partial [Shewanella sp. GXUN23E]|uniref:hypothetical protein n=1 Tax=Shewanella sp. GXUN23E TaxID=3422498 RepID=UPI003D7E5286
MFELKKSRQWWSLLPVMVATVFGSFVVDEAQAKDRAIGFYTRGDVAQAPGSRNGFDNPNVADPAKPANWAEDVDGIVVQVEWAYLQPTRPADPDNTAN